MSIDPRIAFVGTGANGASIAADLTRAGLDVTLIEQWPAHVAAMRANGLTVVMPDRTENTAVTVYDLFEVATLREPFDIVFIVMKAYDTRWACELIKPLVKPDGLVVGLQNGMSIDDIAAVMGPERAVGAVIEVASNMWEPGICNRETPPEEAWFAIGGIHPAVLGREHEVAEVLQHAGTVEVSGDIRSSKWGKLIVNAAELVPSAILDLELAKAIQVPGMYEFMLRCGTEAARTAVDTGVALRPIFGMTDADLDDPERFAEQLFEQVLRRFSSPTTRTTSLQDWTKGRRNEVHEINGLVVDEQRRLGGSAPANERVVELARRIEAGSLVRSPENIGLLLA
ncbi:ketopantoate reductase family protein [Herbiconiux liangxiaofengii]|uniref:ketopantoate reductase family protein n=1 Tax=Herbiconiux liangxiaofengii TaxID=3342795 RepID=UPI0035B90F37